MQYPSGIAYSNAIGSPAIAFRDIELRQCGVEKDLYGAPKVRSGGFAYTFHLTSGSGKEWAVRCLFRDVADIAGRYAAVARLVTSSAKSLFVTAEYQAEGVSVVGACYPIIKMDWLKGVSLRKYLEQAVAGHSSPGRIEELRWLPDAFLGLAKALKAAGVAHGDLSGDNVLVVGNELKLIDYDSMWFSYAPNLVSNVRGQRDYQHPRKSSSDFGPNMDHFSEAAIYLGILAVVEHPTLWGRHNNGQNILLTEDDFLAPEDSPVVRDLLNIPRCAALAVRFRQICHMGVSEIPSLEAFLEGRFGARRCRTVAEATVASTAADVFGSWQRKALLQHVGERPVVVWASQGVAQGHHEVRQPLCLCQLRFVQHIVLCGNLV